MQHILHVFFPGSSLIHPLTCSFHALRLRLQAIHCRAAFPTPFFLPSSDNTVYINRSGMNGSMATTCMNTDSTSTTHSKLRFSCLSVSSRHINDNTAASTALKTKPQNETFRYGNGLGSKFDNSQSTTCAHPGGTAVPFCHPAIYPAARGEPIRTDS